MNTFTRIILPGIFIFFLSVLTVFYFFLTGSLPDYYGTVKSVDIRAPVTVFFDSMGIPQICADKDDDLWFVLGWLHAQERLFQMELTRRVASGRLSAMLGKDALEIDRLQRRIGHRRMAQTALSGLDDITRNRLAAYVFGINAWGRYVTALPFEFYLLGIKFDDWTVLDCLTVYSFQTWYIDYLQNNDALYVAIEKKFGTLKADGLKAAYPEWAPATVPRDKLERIGNLFVPGLNGMAAASNAWVIAPQRSASGSAMLASDPHLDIYRLPQFWYAVGLNCAESGIRAFGITTPGLPFMGYGHNGKAAWAFTAGGVAVTDFYSEKINPQDESLYLTPDGWERFKYVEETVQISGTDSVETLIVRKTRHGPIVQQDDSAGTVTAFCWAGFDADLSEAFKNGFQFVSVSDFDSFRHLITNFGALNANWMYADKSGSIGYQLGSPIPIRDFKKDHFLLPGWDSRYDWDGYYDLEKTPHAVNPQRGWLANCNNKPARDKNDIDVPGNYASDRILRISQLLQSKEKFSTQDLRDFQNDYKSVYLLRWKNAAATVLTQLQRDNLAVAVANWDGDFSGSGQVGALIKHWLFYLKKLTFEDELMRLKSEVENPHMFRDIVLEKVFFTGPNDWFDDIRTEDTTESKELISYKAMHQALDDVGDKSWFELQKLEPAHPFAQNPVIDYVLNLSRGPFPTGGTNSTLCAMTAVKDSLGGFDILVGPSMRLVVDFAHINQTTIVLPAGQSGHPLSEHFFDFYDLWSTEQVWTVPFDMAEIERKAVSQLQLIPK